MILELKPEPRQLGFSFCVACAMIRGFKIMLGESPIVTCEVKHGVHG